MADAQPTSNVPNETLAAAVRDLKAKKNKVVLAQVAYKNTIKDWEDKGVNRKALKSAIRFLDVPEDEFIAEMSHFLRMMAVNGNQKINVLFDGLDLSPLGPEAMRDHLTWQAYDVGYQCGLAGEERTINPWLTGTETYVSWDSGWREGAKTLTGTLPPRTEMASARKERTSPAAPPAPKPEPEWDAKAQAEAERVADEMEQQNAEEEGEVEDDPADEEIELPGGAKIRATSAEPAATPKKKGGRPKGSKNLLRPGRPRGPGRPRRAIAAAH